MAWVNIPDTATDPDAPLTSSLAKAWTGNPVAIAEGAVGAPRIKDAALESTPTIAGRLWVGQRIATAAWDGIGKYVIATRTGTGPDVEVGSVLSGSLLPTSSIAASGGSATALPGTWMCQGRSLGVQNAQSRVTLWARIS